MLGHGFHVRLAICLGLLLVSVCNGHARSGEFAHFAVELPSGWDGDEQTGFISDDKNEYMMTLGIKDGKEERFLAQITVFLLPNKPGADSQGAAARLAQDQGNAEAPRQIGDFWVFRGEPRGNTVKGVATTWVRATPEHLLIIINQDPLNLGGDSIVESLRGKTALAREMLGR